MIIVGGATASGKSGFAVALAKYLNGEIISADSMQIYRKMNVGTAKISKTETFGIPHYMIDIIEPNEDFSVAEFKDRATSIIKDIASRGKTPIIVGGTGLYINSLIYPLNLGSTARNEDLREELQREWDIDGGKTVFSRLTSLDPDTAKGIHPNNKKRVIRALEVVEAGGSIASQDDKRNEVKHVMCAFDYEREALYNRINARVEQMFAEGLENEVDSLLKNESLTFSMQSMQAIGYKEFDGYIKGEYDRAVLIEKIKQHSRNYAKRQITWFKRYKNCVLLKPDAVGNIELIAEMYSNLFAKL